MAGSGRNPAEELRLQLENLHQQDLGRRPARSRSSSSSFASASELISDNVDGPDAPSANDRPRRAATDPRRPHRSPTAVRFADNLVQINPRPDSTRIPTPRQAAAIEDRTAPRSDLNTALYTIDSETDDMFSEQRRRRSYMANMSEAPAAEAFSPPHRAAINPDVYWDNTSNLGSPVSLTRPLPQVGYHGLDGNVKSAVANVSETNITLQNYRDWVTRQRERQREWASGPVGRLKAKATAMYRYYILQKLLRKQPLPRSADGRRIPVRPGRARRKPFIDERTGRPYVSNFIRSSRYTVYDFLPKQLLFQFSRLANFYFLTIGIMQMIPGLSTTGTYTTIAPLCVFVGISMAKEGYDDYRRYKLDKSENRSAVSVLDPISSGDQDARRARGSQKPRSRRRTGRDDTEMNMTELEIRPNPPKDDSQLWSKIDWQDLRVGDIIRLKRDESVPADIALLHATGPNGVAYIETMALDGETNLKSKQASPLLAKHCGSVAGIAACDAEIVSEDPNLDLYNYEGRATVNGETMPLTMNQVVYRGSILRNTTEAIGLVVNTGEECKIRMNAHKNVHAKAPAMQYIVNRIVILLVFLVVMLSIGCTIGNAVWVHTYEIFAWYLKRAQVPSKQIIIGFVIEFNTLIPLSLYVSLEIIKLGQLFLLHDVEMYDPRTDTPMVANTTTILENLGQISYAFSDKTGTLTENLMRFRKLSVAGTAWLHDMDVRREAEEQEKQKRVAERRKRSTARTGTAQASNKKGASRTAQDGTVPLMSGHNPMRGESRGSISQWKSTVRPENAQPELKTDDLIKYLRSKPNTAFSRKARHFLLCVALCHTCLPETKKNGQIDFQAASPDELALVEASRDLGYLLIDRAADSIALQFQDADGGLVTERFQVLDVIEFSSKRKRMSIIIRMPDGKICILTKGADSVILPRLKLSHLAIQKASAVERRATIRKSMEQEKAMRRRSTHTAPVDSSRNLTSQSSPLARRKSSKRRGSSAKPGSLSKRADIVPGEVETWLTRRENEEFDTPAGNDDAYQTPRQSVVRQIPGDASRDAAYDGLVDEALAVNDGAVFERCFQHIDDFASEGLRTLLFAYRYLADEDYRKWKAVYHSATTSLVDRQAQIEAAAELIEQDFDLAGASAIEDKLQQGVPETIDKLRRASIKVWMLTGDKRETAINIAHSARICKPFSEIYILDATEGELQQKIASTLIDVGRRKTIPHSVVVIDGHTLGVVEEDDSLKLLFFDLVTRVDSVICCRASPAQKATLVKCIRDRVPSSLTLAIGDGANDIAMIQAAHVGIGISGREGLQAARIADYSIAQFRFLQRLLFVHGRWNYIRTGKYILGTFWKELLFYLVQAQYQKYNGYTGTSLYETTSLTVFNTLFTSVPVILLGIFEQDLHAETLLAVPELYTFGQRNRGFSFGKYLAWMFMAITESLIIYNAIYGIYIASLFTADTTLFAMGSLAFTVCVCFINVKMLVLELHNKTLISFLGLFISISGWFTWNIFLSAIYARLPGPYIVRDAFLNNFGRNPVWWLTGILTLMALVVFELGVASVRRCFFPQDEDLMQEVERYKGVMEVMKEHAAERGEGAGGGASVMETGVVDVPKVTVKGRDKDRETDPDQASVKSARSNISVEFGNWRLEGAGSTRRGRRMEEEYVPPPFTPPAEERENPMDFVLNGGTGAIAPDGRNTQRGAAREIASPRLWVGDSAGSIGGPSLSESLSLSSVFTESPVELRPPPLGRRGRTGAQPSSSGPSQH